MACLLIKLALGSLLLRIQSHIIHSQIHSLYFNSVYSDGLTVDSLASCMYCVCISGNEYIFRKFPEFEMYQIGVS